MEKKYEIQNRFRIEQQFWLFCCYSKETFDKIYPRMHKYIKEILGILIESAIRESKLIVFVNNKDDADILYKLEKYQGEMLDANGHVPEEIKNCTNIYKCDKCNESKEQTAFFFETED